MYREEGRDRELETSMRESHRSAASCKPPTWDMPATKAHALDWNRTWDPSVPKRMLYPLSQTGLSWFVFLNNVLTEPKKEWEYPVYRGIIYYYNILVGKFKCTYPIVPKLYDV